VWQCRRTAPLVERLKQDGMGSVIRDHTGLVADAYFSGTKLQWLLEHVDGARARADAGELCFGTVDSWLAYHLTNERVHVTTPPTRPHHALKHLRPGVGPASGRE
jgi:glycerol kinase